MSQIEPKKLVLFYTLWCHHSQQFMNTTWPLVVDKYSNNKDFVIEQVDCDENPNKYPITIVGYPTIVLFQENQAFFYNGSRLIDSIEKFMESPQDNADALLLSYSTEPKKVVLFYAPGCDHSSHFMNTTWPLVVRKYANNTDFVIEQVNCDENPQIVSNGYLIGVNKYPTIVLFQGNQVYAYNGHYLIYFIEKFIESPHDCYECVNFNLFDITEYDSYNTLVEKLKNRPF